MNLTIMDTQFLEVQRCSIYRCSVKCQKPGCYPVIGMTLSIITCKVWHIFHFDAH